MEIDVSGALNNIDFRIIANLSLADKKHEEINMSRLTSILNLAPVNVYKHIKKLESKGIIKPEPNLKKGKPRYLKLVKNENTDKLIEASVLICAINKNK